MRSFLCTLPVVVLVICVPMASANTPPTGGYGFDVPMPGNKTVSSPTDAEHIRQNAERGDADAQELLGELYAAGRFVQRDPAMAASWFAKAGAQGLAAAKFNLGTLTYLGRGVTQDTTRAVALFKEAAEAGYAEAETSLGVAYAQGLGVEQSWPKALEWTRKAAAQGNARAEFQLGGSYHYGQGEAVDYVAAAEWYEKAVAQGYAPAQLNLGVMYEQGLGRSKDPVRALSLYQASAATGYSGGEFALGNAYHHGNIVARDYVVAAMWVKRAAEQGDPQAELVLGSYYSRGKGVKVDSKEAFRWLLLAAEQGSRLGSAIAGAAYMEGTVIPQDFAASAKWLQRGIDSVDEQGVDAPVTQLVEPVLAMARIALATLYLRGTGVPLDKPRAASLLREGIDVAEQHVDDATLAEFSINLAPSLSFARMKLGLLYLNGDGVSLDRQRAVVLLRQSGDAGNVEAQGVLGGLYQGASLGPPNGAEAVQWYRRADKGGSHVVQDPLGAIYESGLAGVPKNDVEAAHWYRKAADFGDRRGQFNLARFYAAGRGGLAKDDVEAARWYQRAADGGDILSLGIVAELYFTGRGVPVDYKRAMDLARNSAAHGDSRAENDLGFALLMGYGTAVNVSQACVWLTLATENFSDGEEIVQHARVNLRAAQAKMTASQLETCERQTQEWRVKFSGPK